MNLICPLHKKPLIFIKVRGATIAIHAQPNEVFLSTYNEIPPNAETCTAFNALTTKSSEQTFNQIAKKLPKRLADLSKEELAIAVRTNLEDYLNLDNPNINENTITYLNLIKNKTILKVNTPVNTVIFLLMYPDPLLRPQEHEIEKVIPLLKQYMAKEDIEYLMQNTESILNDYEISITPLKNVEFMLKYYPIKSLLLMKLSAYTKTNDLKESEIKLLVEIFKKYPTLIPAYPEFRKYLLPYASTLTNSS